MFNFINLFIPLNSNLEYTKILVMIVPQIIRKSQINGLMLAKELGLIKF